MIGGLGVGYIAAGEARHVAGSAIRIFGIVLFGKFFAVAGDTFCAEMIYALCIGGSAMWFVAGGAMHGVAGFAFAGALGECFKLADGAGIGLAIG